MIIPYETLSQEALSNLVKEYCWRDWGLNETEAPLDERHAMVLKAVKTGDLVVVYSEAFETANLVARTELELADAGTPNSPEGA